MKETHKNYSDANTRHTIICIVLIVAFAVLGSVLYVHDVQTRNIIKELEQQSAEYQKVVE